MKITDTINGIDFSLPPIWFMRQAGRYLPEYRALRETTSDFISYCLDSDKASEATLQPITRFDFDAAIIFSDILMIPWAMNRNVRFIPGEGPKLDPLSHPKDLVVPDSNEMMAKLQPVLDAIKKTRSALSDEKALIGFCGAPWTVSTYMMEGGSSRDFALSRKWLWQDPAACDQLMDHLVLASIDLLEGKAKAGANILMIFDSWAGVVPSYLRHRFLIDPVAEIISGLRARNIHLPVIAFPKGLSGGFDEYVKATECDVLAIDHTVDPVWLHAHLPKEIVVQGNLDPIAVETGGKSMCEAADTIIKAFSGRPHIFNLGHGIGQFTPIEHVTELLDHLRKTYQ